MIIKNLDGEVIFEGANLKGADLECTEVIIIKIKEFEYRVIILNGLIFCGCMQWGVRDINKIKYADVKSEISLKVFRRLKRAIKELLKGE